MSNIIVLNERQRKLIEENYRIVPFFLKSLSFKSSDYEELLSAGNWGLIKAAATYNSMAGFKFGTYAKTCINNEFFMVMRKAKSKPKIIYLESVAKGEDEKQKRILLEEIVLVDPTDITKGIEDRETVEKIMELMLNMNSIKCKEKQVVFYMLGGMQQSEIGERVDLSQGSISRIIKNSFKKIKSQIECPADYDRTIQVNVTPTKYKLNIILDSEAECKLVYQMLAKKMTYTDGLQDYVVRRVGDFVTVELLADIEAFITIAEILQEIEPYIQKRMYTVRHGIRTRYKVKK